MAKRSSKKGRNIETYAHTDKKRVSNLPDGLVTSETDQNLGTNTYAHDQHLNPHFSWVGKSEHTSYKVPTISLHVYERIDQLSFVELIVTDYDFDVHRGFEP